MNSSNGQPMAIGADLRLSGPHARPSSPTGGRQAMARKASEQYLQKLKNPQWQKMRLQVLERDEWCCQICFDKEQTLHVHHMWYVRGRNPWEYPMEALITLCETCHEEETDRLPSAAEYLIHVLKTAGAMSFDMDQLSEVVPPHFVGCSGASPDWAVIAFGFGEILKHHAWNDEDWCAMRERYFAQLKNLREPAAKRDGDDHE